jgi:ArsR family transcriptional regulator, arsenate/arsenite/antimonite-responsive transcriptional repressor / arsenate reductase (thioredoxin)
MNAELTRRAAVHAALGDPSRLAIVDELLLGDRSPSELAAGLGLPSNLLAHHLHVLEAAGVVERTRSEADRRRTYVRLIPAAPAATAATAGLTAPRVVFVCTHNSARSQLAAALWSRRSDLPAASAGTRPRDRVHRRAVSVARRHGLSLAGARPASVGEVLREDDLVVAVCDSAYEELGADPARLHWSVPDPARVDEDAAFERAYEELEDRVGRLAPVVDRPVQSRAPHRGERGQRHQESR